MKRAVFAVLLLLFSAEIYSACSESVPLATQGQKCEFDEQCSQGLVCKCVRRRNPDDEGPDEILAPGFCTTLAAFTKCPSDAGVADTAFDAPTPVDAAPEVAPDAPSEVSDAVDDGG